LTFYLDTSLLVSALMPDEIASAQSKNWLRSQRDMPSAISAWTVTEVASALAGKVRSKALSTAGQTATQDAWQRLRHDSLVTLPIEFGLFDVAAGLASRHDLNLRAGDALHIAIAARHGCTLATLDRVMAAAARACGLAVEEIVK